MRIFNIWSKSKTCLVQSKYETTHTSFYHIINTANFIWTKKVESYRSSSSRHLNCIRCLIILSKNNEMLKHQPKIENKNIQIYYTVGSILIARIYRKPVKNTESNTILHRTISLIWSPLQSYNVKIILVFQRRRIILGMFVCFLFIIWYCLFKTVYGFLLWR